MMHHMSESSRPPADIVTPQAVLAGSASGRTPVGFIVGISATTACAIVALGIYAAQSFADGDGAAPFALALPLALLPVPLLVAVVLWMDRLEPEPRTNLAFAFGWGAGIAALSALVINTANLEYVTMPALGASRGEYVAATFGAPVVEETLKGLVLVGLLWRRRAEFDGPTDGVIYAAMVGLGFAMIENVGYYINAFVSPSHSGPYHSGIVLLGYTFVLRGLLSPLLHPVFTSMTGLGVAYSAGRRGGAPWAVALGLLAAMVLHGTWNGLSLFGAAGLATGYAVMMAVLAALVWVLVADRRRVIRLIRRYLPRYERTGLVTPEDIEMLANLPARAAARRWARAVGGRPGGNQGRASGGGARGGAFGDAVGGTVSGLPAGAAMADYQLAATELALARAKADRGLLDFNEFAEREHALLTLMALARRSLTSRLPAGAHHARPPWAAAATTFTPGPGPGGGGRRPPS
jgi:RsiW-degrading membrane proteinase PrsW (M82 family)